MPLPTVALLSTNFRIFNIHLLKLDEHKTRRTASVPLHFLFKRVILTVGICEVHINWSFVYIQAPLSESAQQKWSSYLTNRRSWIWSLKCSKVYAVWVFWRFLMYYIYRSVWAIPTYRVYRLYDNKRSNRQINVLWRNKIKNFLALYPS